MMALRKLPNDVQSLFCATSKITSYKRAIEELVYNALDADSTSIAIRVNIEENTIQVIDNGCGIAEKDFTLLGQKHATSKCTDLDALKSAPNKYGFKGQALASIIEISHSVKLTSRCYFETWSKTFYKGKEKVVGQATNRPSRGTTIEIKGFLYNLNIQKHAVNAITEIQDIKSFLQHISVVHSNISLSLRDDSRNEIVFKLHKNRDVYQTLLSLFAIEKKDIQELKVEKNQYKVTGLIGKSNEEVDQRHWIYLNGKLIQNKILNKLVTDNFIKTLGLRINGKKNVQYRNFYHDQEKNFPERKTPFYFIFITCPYYDYDISYTPKQSVLEFKSWEQITKLLEKLIKFYAGEHKVAVTANKIHEDKNNIIEDDTRDKIKKIMEKILGSHLSKPGVSQMQNGVKGKPIKRKKKKEKKVLNISLLKVLPPKISDTHVKVSKQTNKFSEIIDKDKIYSVELQTKIKTDKTKKRKLKQMVVTNNKNNKARGENNIYDIMLNESIKLDKTDKAKKSKGSKSICKNANKHKQCLPCPKKLDKKRLNQKQKNKIKDIALNDPIIKKFNKESSSVKKRCNMLSRQVQDLIKYKRKMKRKIFVNETVQYSNIIKNNKNYSVRKKIEEIVIHDYPPSQPAKIPCTFDNRIWNRNDKKNYKCTSDLLQTVLPTQKDTFSICVENNPKRATRNEQKEQTSFNIHRQTYESHNYENYGLFDKRFEDRDKHFQQQQDKNFRFITTQSKDNFLAPKDHQKIRNQLKIQTEKQNHKSTPYLTKRFKFMRKFNQAESSYTIEFSEVNRRQSSPRMNINNSLNLDDITIEPKGTYTIHRENRISEEIDDHTSMVLPASLDIDSELSVGILNSRETECNALQKTYLIQKSKSGGCHSNDWKHSDEPVDNCTNNIDERNQNMNIIFISKSQENQKQFVGTSDKLIEPLNVCETVLSGDVFDKVERNHQWNDSLFNNDFDLESLVFDRNAYTCTSPKFIPKSINCHDDVSHHFEFIENAKLKENAQVHYVNNDPKENNIAILTVAVNSAFMEKNDKEYDFHFKNRHRFVPKGMSPIFENCKSNNVITNNDEGEYYEKAIYNDFANNVQTNSEVFKPRIQSVNELASRDIEKVNSRLSKDNANLKFTGVSLKEADVLQQVDTKFISAKVKGKAHQGSTETSEFLVLFDQHAVHERIQLEDNLADYVTKDEWKSVALDNVQLKLSKNDVLYLHNYKDKFEQFGLQWTNLNSNEISINAIPKAILGKNPRQVEVVVKAAKNLILEEINAIQTQKGCVSLYPKAIMDLVFSEACRYAIKFGDKLTKTECETLLRSLSECKTPFQCAHGRPVMALLMEIKNEARDYKINMESLMRFKVSRKR